MLSLKSLLFHLFLIFSTAYSLPIFRKREIVTRVHTASTTNTVTDFYSTTTEIIVAPTVKFIVSGSVTFTTTLTPSDANPTAIPSTVTTVEKNIIPTSDASSNENSNQQQGSSTNSEQNSGSSTGSSNQNSNSNNENSGSNSNNQNSNSNDGNSGSNSNDGNSGSNSNDGNSGSNSNSNGNQNPGQDKSSSTPTVKPTTSKATVVSSSSKDRTTLTPTTVTTSSTSSSSSEKDDSSSESTSTTTVTMTELDTIYTTTYTTSSAPDQNSPTLTVSSTKTSSSSVSSTQSAQPSSSSNLIQNVPYSLTYSPYNNDGTCRSADDVYSDLAKIKAKGVANIRVYGTDCNSLNTVQPAASKLGIRINQGLYITSEGVDSIDGSLQDLINYAKTSGWDIFDYITVGNEAIQSDYCTVEQLISKVSSVKQALKAAGYQGQITVSEPPVVFENNPDLCTKSEIDFVGINAHSYFDPNSNAETAGQFVKGQVQLIQNVCGTANVVVTETGFPAAGKQNGGNIPSTQNQYIAIQSILNEMQQSVTILSAFDDKWKAVGPYGIEQSFGILQILA